LQGGIKGGKARLMSVWTLGNSLREMILSQNTKWRSHFVFLKPLQGLVFNSQKCSHTFVNWY
jgi:hypothetical protein